MSEEEFLARWSRRKRESQAELAKPAAAQPTPPPEVKDDEGEFDLSSLPSIDEINAATDITAFLGKKIPRDLSRAALRRAWATDPAISRLRRTCGECMGLQRPDRDAGVWTIGLLVGGAGRTGRSHCRRSARGGPVSRRGGDRVSRSFGLASSRCDSGFQCRRAAGRGGASGNSCCSATDGVRHIWG
ncbi:hypothetical protein ACVIHB_004406 [Bradyrhizobium liaoningense]